MLPRICVLGSLNMDLVIRTRRLPRAGETLLAGPFATHPGGKGANQALAAARMGAEVVLIGHVGEDAFGRELVAELGAAGVDVGLVRALPDAPSGVALVTVEEGGENTILVAPGANLRVVGEDLAAGTERARAIAHASTVLAQLEVPLHAVAAAADRAREAGARFVLNAAPAARVPDELLERVDVLVVNLVEARGLVGAEDTDGPEELSARLLRRGPGIVVVTLGTAGALGRAGGEVIRQPAYRVRSVDAVGAGDAFTAALAVGLDEGLPLAAALRFGCAAGALATTVEGAQPALPDRAAVEALAATDP